MKKLLIVTALIIGCKTTEHTNCAAYTDKQTNIIREVEKQEEKEKKHTGIAAGCFAVFIAVRNYFTKPQL